jgi:50S ribosomal protein L16 3-hydroxylase
MSQSEYLLELHDLTVEQFLAEYWQKKPLLIKGGFTNFIDPISPDELAGLAAEEEIESRVVSKSKGQWQLETGPFEDYTAFGEQDWTLLVQAVDHWHPESAVLIEPFRFIPNWRIDDLMISFSTPGGGVGPHLDQYDVFIIQGMGKRHWRVGMPDATLTQHCPHPRLLQISPFVDCIDVITEPGDILYIPPGCPHDGISVDASLNYSVGFRAPAQKDLLTGLADYLIENEIQGERYADPERTVSQAIGEITPADLSSVQQLLQGLINDPNLLAQYFGSYITHAKHELDATEPDPHYHLDEIAEYLQEGSVLARLGGLRCCYIQQSAQQDILLFINGHTIKVPASELSTVKELCEHTHLDAETCLRFADDPAKLQLLTMLINQGYWYFVE